MPYLDHAGAQLSPTDEDWELPALLAARHRFIALHQRTWTDSTPKGQAAPVERALPTGPTGPVEVLAGAGYVLHPERPDETNALLLDWIHRLPDPAGAAS